MTDWTPDDTDDRIERIVDDARGRPETADVEYDDDELIKITFEDRTTLPEGFDEWADANDLSIRDFTVVPETDGFVVVVALLDELDRLSHGVAGSPFHRFGADPSAGAERGHWMAHAGRFGHPHARRFRGFGPRAHGDRLRAACTRLRHTLDDDSSRFPFGPGGPAGSGRGRSE